MPEPIDVVEALLFASDSPLEADRIREVLDLADATEARALVEALRERYATADGALTVVEVGGGFRMVTRPEIAPWLMRLARTRTKARLSRPALETLAIVAYRQPVSRPEVDALRGVNSDAVLDNLLERRLVRIAGRKEAPGRPFLYETTREFLVAFGLRDLGDLPKVEGELIVPEIVGDALAPALDAPGESASADGSESMPEPATEATPEPAEAVGPTEAVELTEAVEPTEDGTAETMPETMPVTAPPNVVDSMDGQTEAEQDPRPGGSDLTPGR